MPGGGDARTLLPSSRPTTEEANVIRMDRERRRRLRRRALRFVVAVIEEYGRGVAVTAPLERRT
jgi:hypothetical protein